jgi:integrase-like protein
VVTYRFRGEHRKQFTHTYAEARDLKAQLATDIRRGEYHDAGRVTFEAYDREWIDTYQGRTTRGCRESTRVGYRRTLEQKAIPFFSKRTTTLAELEPRDVRAYVAWLFDPKARGQQLAVGTVRQHVAAVRAMLATAVEDDLIRHSPATGVTHFASGHAKARGRPNPGDGRWTRTSSGDSWARATRSGARSSSCSR